MTSFDADSSSSSAAARVIADLGPPDRGPVLAALGGVHGNEPAGVEALDRVAREITGRSVPLAGRAIFLRGNVAALERGVRLVEEDLNRIWTPRRVVDADARDPDGPWPTVETRELAGILRVLRAVTPASPGRPFHALDLHTASADCPPFGLIGDTLRSRGFALDIPVPILLGLEEALDGDLLEFLSTRGVVTVAFEGGRHGSAEAVEALESATWLALVRAGIVAGHDAEADRHRDRLAGRTRHLPPVLEVRHRHAVRPDDAFCMEPGWKTFDPVRRGQIVAHDRRGPIRAPETGLMLLPLYQPVGDDGFFLARPFERFWLGVSARLRHLPADRLTRRLPGIAPDPGCPDTLVVDRRVARWFPLQWFHLLGYRKVRGDHRRLVVTRRPYDARPPDRLRL